MARLQGRQRETKTEFSLNSSSNNTRQINPSRRHRYEVSGALKISIFRSAFRSFLQEQSGHLNRLWIREKRTLLLHIGSRSISHFIDSVEDISIVSMSASFTS